MVKKRTARIAVSTLIGVMSLWFARLSAAGIAKAENAICTPTKASTPTAKPNQVEMQLERLEIDRGFAQSREYFHKGLTPELSRTAARNGGVVHVTMQPSREAVSA